MIDLFLLNPKHAPILQGDRSALEPNEFDNELGKLAGWGAGCFTLLGILALWTFFVAQPNENAYWDQHALTTQALVTSCLMRSSGKSVTTEVTYTFEIDGTPYQSADSVQIPETAKVCSVASPGRMVEIEYLPDAPEKTAYGRKYEVTHQNPLVVLIGSLLLMIITGWGATGIYNRRQTIARLPRLRDEGILLFGTMTEMEFTWHFTGGKRIVRITYEFTTPSGLTSTNKTATTERNGFGNLQPPQKMVILYVDDTLYKPL